MPRNPETTSTGDQVEPEDRFRTGASDPARPDRAATPDPEDPGVTGSQPGVTAAAVTAGLAGHPLTAIPDDDAAAEPGEDRGAAGGPVDAGFRGVPPTEGQWVAGTRDPAEVPAEAGEASTPPGGLRAGAGAGAGAGAPLLPDQDGLRERWLQIQSGFIDDPRASVTEAAGFVGEITTTIVTAVQERERSLRGAWDTDRDADTESLRNAIREYRTFFELLTKL